MDTMMDTARSMRGIITAINMCTGENSMLTAAETRLFQKLTTQHVAKALTTSKWDPVAWLKTRHTRVLMKMREGVYRTSGYNYYAHDAMKDEELWYDPFDSHMYYVSLAQIKAELATREHVTNKKEARAIRQERARRKR
jgi:hypothetical protein